MGNVTKWFRKAFDILVEPDDERIIQQIIPHLKAHLKAKQGAFKLSEAMTGIECTASQSLEARRRILNDALELMWGDGFLDAKERAASIRLTEVLELPDTERSKAIYERTKREFVQRMSQALEDGVLDAQEERDLERLTSAVGKTLPEFSAAVFRETGEAILRGLFIESIQDGALEDYEWQRIVTLLPKLGLTLKSFQDAIRKPAELLIERAFADAKEDGEISPQEKQGILKLMQRLGITGEFAQYVSEQLSRVERISKIKRGEIDAIAPPQLLSLSSSELLYLFAPAKWRRRKMLKSGLHEEDFPGQFAITDNRLIFLSNEGSFNVSLSKIISSKTNDSGIHFQTGNSPVWSLYFAKQDPIAAAIFESVMLMTNRRLTRSSDALPTRHIPREVRQRVWQRYSGRCAECGDTKYLEFDHIVPVSKGGSNSDANVQLLCRGCNLKKSNFI